MVVLQGLNENAATDIEKFKEHHQQKNLLKKKSNPQLNL
jgi:hypothetical protein